MRNSMIALSSILLFALYGCYNAPYYKSNKRGRVVKTSYSAPDTLKPILITIEPIQTKSSELNNIIDTIKLAENDDLFSLNLSKEFHGAIVLDFKSLPSQDMIEMPYKRSIPEFIQNLELEGNALVIAPAYRFCISNEREGGGGIGLHYSTGFQFYDVIRTVYVAIIDDSELVYLNNSERFDRYTLEENQSLQHEFPSDIADELLNRALKNYLERLE